MKIYFIFYYYIKYLINCFRNLSSEIFVFFYFFNKNTIINNKLGYFKNISGFVDYNNIIIREYSR